MNIILIPNQNLWFVCVYEGGTEREREIQVIKLNSGS